MVESIEYLRSIQCDSTSKKALIISELDEYSICENFQILVVDSIYKGGEFDQSLSRSLNTLEIGIPHLIGALHCRRYSR